MKYSLRSFKCGMVCLPMITMLCISCAGNRLFINTDGPAIATAKAGNPEYTIYALGDAGLENDQSRAVIEQIRVLSGDDFHPGMVLFLGDNIYPAGFESSDDPEGYQRSANLLKNQTDAFSTYGGKIIYIPGNHDWNEFKPGGLAAIQRQEQYLKSLEDLRIQFLPGGGCAGPTILQLTDQVVMFIIDSQWWIQDWKNEPDINSTCRIRSREDFKTAFHAYVQAYGQKQIIIAMHHPLYSQGSHGGHFTVRDHLFPLTKVVPWLWIPLPVIGSIYPGYRSIIGHPQDLKHPRYKSLKEALLNDLNYTGEMIFLAGHDHNLQYITAGSNHHLLSGSGAKQNQVAKGKHLQYGHRAAGFMELQFYGDKSIQLTVYEVDVSNNSSEIVFRKIIVNGR